MYRQVFFTINVSWLLQKATEPCIRWVILVLLYIYRSAFFSQVLQLYEEYVFTRNWTTSDFLKSTFMWWKSSRSRLVADDVINEQISLELWQTPCARLWHMTQRCPCRYCSYNSSFLSVLLSLGCYIFHSFLLVLNQTDKVAQWILHSYECISESDCVFELILPGSVSLWYH